MINTTPLDVSAHLTDDDVIGEYLTAAAEDDDPSVFIAALGEVAKARGMTEIARQTGLGRESLYKSLKAGGRPGYATVDAILKSMDLRFIIAPRG